MLLLLGLLVWLGWFSTVAHAPRPSRCAGVSDAAAAQVRRSAAVPLGGPLMRVDTDAVQERLVAGKAWREVSVSRSLPHTVVVDVTPRVAVLAVRGARGRVEVVDGEGVVFATVASPPAGVPVVSSGAAHGDQGGGDRGAPGARLARARAAPQRLRGRRVEADQVSFRLKVKDATKTVVWGGSGDGATKAQARRRPCLAAGFDDRRQRAVVAGHPLTPARVGRPWGLHGVETPVTRHTEMGRSARRHAARWVDRREPTAYRRGTGS